MVLGLALRVYRTLGSGFRTLGLGFRALGLGFRTAGLGFRALGLGLWVEGRTYGDFAASHKG